MYPATPPVSRLQQWPTRDGAKYVGFILINFSEAKLLPGHKTDSLVRRIVAGHYQRVVGRYYFIFFLLKHILFTFFFFFYLGFFGKPTAVMC